MRVTVRDVSATDQVAKHTTPLTMGVKAAARVFGGSFAALARRLVLSMRPALYPVICACLLFAEPVVTRSQRGHGGSRGMQDRAPDAPAREWRLAFSA